MKMRAFLLIAILIGGSYTMIQSFNDYNEKQFTDLLNTMNPSFTTALFTKPSTSGNTSETWHVDEHSEIDSLLNFLQGYHVRKLKPEEINTNDETEEFSIQLQDKDGNTLSILVNENLIIQNSLLYYEIVDGPLDTEWLVHFFISNQI
ncbi:hypothetical protein [Sporosarcina sp. FSL K6-3457]|uniref:hypothetical protein n=1 Tax=Sporosarcina sp. FSL K6-3457 TaxID=2978204 RepID=UPI0030F5C6F2